MKKFYIFMLIVLLFFNMASCYKRTDYDQQGSIVLEMPYQEITEDFITEVYNDYSSFKKSEIADYRFSFDTPAKYDRYNKEYFKENNLLVLKFNKQGSGYHFFVKNVLFNQNQIEVSLINRYLPENSDKTTYYCFIETTNDINHKSILLDIIIKEYDKSISASYINSENQLYLINGLEKIVSYIITDKAGIDEFATLDNLPQNYFRYKAINKEASFFENNYLLLIQVCSSVVIQWSVEVNESNINIYGFSSSNYWLTEDYGNDYHELIICAIPKEKNINTLNYYMFYEYLDSQNTTEINFSEQLNITTITENLIRLEY